MDLWETIKSWMGSGFTVFVYVAIVVLFIIGVARCILPVMRTRDLLKRAIKNIRKGDKARRSWQDDRFLGRGALMPHWSEYLNNLFFADGEYHNPSNVEDYINEETVIDGPGSVRLAEAVPGVLVSLGFLGTLLGLSISLSGMGEVDPEAINANMSMLIGSMKYAFLTSVFGVIGSILFTLLTRIVHGRAERSLTEFYNAMARHAGVLSVDPMTQIAIYQQEQTGLLRTLLEMLNPEKADSRVSSVVSQSVAPLASALNKHLNASSEMQAKHMAAVADKYIQSMDDAMHGQLDRLSATIADTCRYQEKAVKNVSDALSSFSDAARAMRDIRQNSELVLEKYESALNRVAQNVARQESSMEKIDSVVRAQSEYLSMLEGLNDAFSRQSAAISDATNEFMDNSNRLNRENADALRLTAERVAHSGESLSGVVSSAREKLSRDMDESLNYFEACMTEILKRIEWASNAIKESVEGLPDAVKDSAGAYLNEIDAFSETLRAARGRLSASAGAGE